MTISSKASRTSQVRQRILSYLDENPEIIRCVRGYEKNRKKVFLKRIETFDGFSIDKDINNDGRLFHHVALRAVLNFIAQYPNIDHTPSSLRSLFSVPTRRNRKKGKHSGKTLRDQAVTLSINPDNLIFQMLINKINRIDMTEQYSEAKTCLLQKLEEINQRISPPILPQNLDNDHSERDLNRTADFISSFITDAEFITRDPDETLAPDLVFRVDQRVFFVELKVWDPGFQLFLKPALQVFKYATHPGSDGVIFILANESPTPTIFDQMKGRYSGKQIFRIVKRNFDNLSQKNRGENLELKKLQKIGIVLRDKGNLSVRDECILQSIIAEMTSESLGKTNMDIRTGNQLKDLLRKHEHTIFDINEFNKENVDKYLYCGQGKEIPILQGRMFSSIE